MSQSRLSTQMAAERSWDTEESAVEVIADLVDQLHSDLGGSVPSGAAIIGKVGIDQTTDGTTNLVVAKKPSVTQVVSTVLEASHVLKSSAGNLVQLSIFNSKASSQFILLMNSTTVPSDGAVTLLYPPIPIAAASLLVLDLPTPLVASTGIAVSNSSTGTFTKTIGSADCVFYAQVN